MASRPPWIDKGERPKKKKDERKTSTSFQQFAKKKLEKHPDFKDRGDNERELLAHHLTDKDKILYKYFGTISSDLASSNIKFKMEEDQVPLESDRELEAAELRAKGRVEEVAKFDVKLLLRHIDVRMSRLTRAGARILNLWYGPLHTALLINDKVLVEWNTGSLVIPEKYRHGDMRYPLVMSVLHQVNQVDEPTNVRGEEIDLIFKAAALKQDLLNCLVDVISKYNSMFTYNAAFRNCQHFVIDALQKMGCENTPMFEGRMAEYYRRLEAGLERIDFDDNHTNLDQYVTENILNVSNSDRQAVSTQHKEYLLSQYFEFHIRELTNSQDPDQWQCSQGDNCKVQDLESCMDDDTRSEHQYLCPRIEEN